MAETEFYLPGLHVPFETEFVRRRVKRLRDEVFPAHQRTEEGMLRLMNEVRPYTKLEDVVVSRILSGVRLADVNWTGVVIRGFDLTRIRLIDSVCDLSTFDTVNASDARFDGSRFRYSRWFGKTSLVGSDLQNVDFSGADLDDVNFENCILRKASFCAAVLRRIRFVNSDISECDFSRADIDGCEFGKAKFEQTDFSFAQINDCRFPPVEIEEANFYEAVGRGWADQRLPQRPPFENKYMILKKLEKIERTRSRVRRLRWNNALFALSMRHGLISIS